MVNFIFAYHLSGIADPIPMLTKISLISPPIPRRSESLFYIGMALVAIVITIAGFLPTAVDTSSRREPMSLAVAAHGAVFGAWLLLFLTQTIFVQKGRIAFHRLMGSVGIILAFLMVVSGYLTSIRMAQRGYDLSGDLVQATTDHFTILVLQLGDLLTFSLLIGFAIGFRHRPDIHKRLMLLATIALIPAALTHIIGHSPFLREIQAPIIVIPLIMLLFAGAVHDRIYRGRIHPVFLWVPLAMFVWSNLRAVVIGPSETWHTFAAWLIQ